MRRLCALSLAAFAVIAVCAPAVAQTPPVYDLVLEGGRVLDPDTGLDAVRSVAVRDGRIAAISAGKLSGKVTVDVKGLVVAPGFIDLHAHGLDPVSTRLKAQDGVTTHLETEIGVFPVKRWYDELAGVSLINYGATVSHGAVRANVVDGFELGSFDSAAEGAGLPPGRRLPPRPARWADDALTPAELEQLESRLRQGLDEGALGIGFGIAYTPGAKREEIWRAMKVGADNRVRSFVHLRFGGALPDTGSVAALQEVLANAASVGAALHVAHISTTGRRDTPVMLQMIDAAKTRGIDISTEAYPWTAASTGIGSAIFDPGWEKRVGATAADLEWPATGERLTPETFARYRREQPRASVIAHIVPEEVVEATLKHKEVAIVSDGPSYSNGPGHPRGAGSFARVLGRYVRDRKVMSLNEAVGKMTIVPARLLETSVPAMSRKGRLQIGSDADITIFSAEQVAERATYAQSLAPSAGIRHVIVMGVFVVRDGRIVEGVSPGVPIRRATVDHAR